MSSAAEQDDIWAQVDAARQIKPEPDVHVHATSVHDVLLRQSSEVVTHQRLLEERKRSVSAQAIGRVHDAIAAQLHALWCINGRNKIAEDDFITGSSDVREKCRGCDAPQLLRLHVYLIQPQGDEPASMIDALRRQKTSKEMFLRDEALHDAELCGLIGAAQKRSIADLAERQKQKANKMRSRIDMGVYNCLLHACIDDYCVLQLGATKKQRDMYNRMHSRLLPTAGTQLESYVYFCAQHTRFHMCDEFCDQTEPGRHGECVCTLSSRVKRAAELDSALADTGFGNSMRGGAVPNGSNNADGTSVRDSEPLVGDEDMGFSNAPNDEKPAVRRRAAYSEVSVIRDRGDNMRQRMMLTANGTPIRGTIPRRRGRGRGRGSIAGASAERARLDRIRLAQSMIKSSGDDDANILSPQQAALQFERLAAGEMGRRAIGAAEAMLLDEGGDDVVMIDGSEFAGAKRSTSKRRKLGRAKRVKSRLASQAAQMTLDLPSEFLEAEQSSSEDEEDDNAAEPPADIPPEPQLPRVKEEPREDDDGFQVVPEPLLESIVTQHDIAMNAYLALPIGGDQFTVQHQNNDALIAKRAKRASSAGNTLSVSFDVRAKIPFAERAAGKYDQEFAIDVLVEQRDRNERLSRFNLSGSATTNTFFSTTELLQQYGERACAIVWRIMCSHERDAVEKNKLIVCTNKTRSEVDAYMSTQRKEKRVCFAERIERICRTSFDKSGMYKRIVIDEALWKIIETYTALLVIEFYFNLVSLPRKESINLMPETADTIQNQFFFENFVPAILSFMCEGLEVNGVVILPRDSFFVREWWPQTATLRTLGIADQTMTHLVSTIRAYIEAARSSNVSMRRFEATTLEFDTLVSLRLPGVVPGSETMRPKELARAAARHVVSLFIEARARRLEALVQY